MECSRMLRCTDCECSIIKDDTFSFVVGPQRQRYNIHISALKAISEPLGVMMTNGKMEESIRGEAILKDVEPAVFEQLVQFAYLGLGGIHDGVLGMATPATSADLKFHCPACDTLKTDSDFFPYCSKDHHGLYMKVFNESKKHERSWAAKCVACGSRFSQGPTTDPFDSFRPFCQIHNQKPYIGHYDNITNFKKWRLVSATSSLAPPSLTYGAAGLSHDQLRNLLDRYQSDVTMDRYPTSTSWAYQSIFAIQHAKVYILSQKYMVKDLQDISLHKLDRCLISLEVEDDIIDNIIDLVLLAYSETPDGGDILQNTTDKLRHLVMMYVSHMSKKLLAYETFRSMISAGGAHTADFFALKYAKGEY